MRMNKHELGYPCDCKGCIQDREALQKQLDHPFYAEVDEYRDEVKHEALEKAATKYDEPFNPFSWTPEQLFKHAMAENYDQSVYITGLYKQLMAAVVGKEELKITLEKCEHHKKQLVKLTEQNQELCKERDYWQGKYHEMYDESEKWKNELDIALEKSERYRRRFNNTKQMWQPIQDYILDNLEVGNNEGERFSDVVLDKLKEYKAMKDAGYGITPMDEKDMEIQVLNNRVTNYKYGMEQAEKDRDEWENKYKELHDAIKNKLQKFEV